MISTARAASFRISCTHGHLVVEEIGDGLAALLGTTAKAVIRRPSLVLFRVMPADRPAVRSQLRDAVTGGRAWHQVFRIRAPGEDDRWIQVQSSCVRGADGFSWSGVAMD